MSIKTYEPASLSLRQLISAMPVMTRWHNSKGRIMPLHLRSAPGQGKTMIARQAAHSMARAKPGVPVGVSVCTPLGDVPCRRGRVRPVRLAQGGES